MKRLISLASIMVLSACGTSEFDQTSTASVQPWEDCIKLDLNTVKVSYVGGEYKIVSGATGSHWAFSFGQKKDEAHKALEIIKAYKMENSCFVNRPNQKMSYLLTPAGTSPQAATNLVANEDCINFNNANVEAKWFPAPLNTWKIVDGNMWMLDFGLDQNGVYKALRVIKEKKFNQQCFVGRPQTSFAYWKIQAAAPLLRADLQPVGNIVIGTKRVNFGGQITLTRADAALVSSGKPAFNISYQMKNNTPVPASGFKNKLIVGNQAVSIQTAQSIGGLETKIINTQAYLAPGTYTLRLVLDTDGNVIETNETNNSAVITVNVVGPF